MPGRATYGRHKTSPYVSYAPLGVLTIIHSFVDDFLMLATIVGFSGLVLNGPAAISSRSTAVPRASRVMMPVERIPGEGDPFRDDNMRRAEDIAIKQPRGIAEAGRVP